MYLAGFGQRANEQGLNSYHRATSKRATWPIERVFCRSYMFVVGHLGRTTNRSSGGLRFSCLTRQWIFWECCAFQGALFTLFFFQGAEKTETKIRVCLKTGKPPPKKFFGGEGVLFALRKKQPTEKPKKTGASSLLGHGAPILVSCKPFCPGRFPAPHLPVAIDPVGPRLVHHRNLRRRPQTETHPCGRKPGFSHFSGLAHVRFSGEPNEYTLGFGANPLKSVNQ